MGDIAITQWTPELIPAELPPNVEPELVEPHYKKNGEAIRTTAHRKHEAVCLNPRCPLAWSGSTAFPEATAHTANTGHLTRLYYVAEYTMAPNPLHPKMLGRLNISLSEEAEANPNATPVLGQPPVGRRPVPNGAKTRAIRRDTQRKQEAMARDQALNEILDINTYGVTPQDLDADADTPGSASSGRRQPKRPRT